MQSASGTIPLHKNVIGKLYSHWKLPALQLYLVEIGRLFSILAKLFQFYTISCSYIQIESVYFILCESNLSLKHFQPTLFY